MAIHVRLVDSRRNTLPAFQCLMADGSDFLLLRHSHFDFSATLPFRCCLYAIVASPTSLTVQVQVLRSSSPVAFDQPEIGDSIDDPGLVGVLGINFDVFTVRTAFLFFQPRAGWSCLPEPCDGSTWTHCRLVLLSSVYHVDICLSGLIPAKWANLAKPWQHCCGDQTHNNTKNTLIY